MARVRQNGESSLMNSVIGHDTEREHLPPHWPQPQQGGDWALTRTKRGVDGLRGGVPREQNMLMGHLPSVIYHQVYLYTNVTDPGSGFDVRQGMTVQESTLVLTALNLGGCGGVLVGGMTHPDLQ